jgi:hypothetical protein
VKHLHLAVKDATPEGFKPKSKIKGVYPTYNWRLHDGLPHNTLNKSGTSSGLRADNKNSKYLGKHPIRNATRPQKFMKPNINSSIFYNNFIELFKEYDVNVDRCVISRGCWHTNKHVLQRQLVPEIEGDFSKIKKVDIKFFDRHARNVIRKLRITPLPKCKKHDIVFSSFNRDTYPGLRYDQYLYKYTKKAALIDAYRIAAERWDTIDKGKFRRKDIIPSIYTIGARNKRDDTYTDDELATSRVVHMPEFHAELTSGPWTDQITNHLKNKKSGPIFIGNSLLESDRLSKALEGRSTIFEGDWKRFDSTLYLRIIISAVAIMRCYYDLEDSEIDSHFVAIFDCVGIKDYYTPAGNMFRAFHGLPSGVKSTNLIGSIINMLALDYCCGEGANRDFNYVCGGDDFVIASNSTRAMATNFSDKLQARAERIGMRFKFLTRKYNDATNIEELPCFYKYVVTSNGSPAIPTSAMLGRVFMPWSKSYGTLPKIYKFLNDIMPSLGRPGTNLLAYYIFYQNIYYKTFNNKISFKDVVSRHFVVYNKMVLKKEFPNYKNETDYAIPLVDLPLALLEVGGSLSDLSVFKE